MISKSAEDIAKNTKILVDAQKEGTVFGDILSTANHGHVVRLSSEDIKYIAKETGLPEYKVYMAWG